MEKINNDQLHGLMSLSEEISSLNMKMGQLVEQLHSSAEGLTVLKDMATTLSTKISQFKTQASGYKPQTITPGVNATPSYENNSSSNNSNTGGKRERIVPTPDNYMDYMPGVQQIQPEPSKPEPLPTAAEITKVTSNPVIDRATGERAKKPVKPVRQQTGKTRPPKKPAQKQTKKTEPTKKRGFFGGR